jgi:UDP-2,3-diacylglucosamine pyrophosphatase LpxH
VTHFSDYDAVLLDINLDKWGDMPLTEAVRCIGGSAPIVLVSGKWDGEDGRTTIARTREALSLSKDVHFVQILILNDLAEENGHRRVEATRAQLRLAIARHQRRGMLKLGDNDPVHILHLSDPQYGDPDTDGWAAMTEDEIADLVGKVQPDIHFVAITGDISYQGLPSEYGIALNRLEPMLQELFIGKPDWRERILLVPGNHDVNLRLSAADSIRYDFAHRSPTLICAKDEETGLARYALHPFRDFAWKLTGDPNWREADDLCWINDGFRHLGIRFYLLSSAGDIDCANPDSASIPTRILRQLARDRTRSEKLFSIVFSHHGPPDENEDSESITNWQEVAKFMQNTGIRLFVHGHGHKREAVRQGWEQQQTRNNRGKLGKDEFLRVMAPTTHLNNELRADGASRGFSIITLHRSNGQVERVEIDSYRLGAGSPKSLECEEFRF